MSGSSGNRSRKPPNTAQSTQHNCCKRCGAQFPKWQGVSCHYKKCSVVVSSQYHDSISHHPNDNIDRTASSTEMVDDESYLEEIYDAWDDDSIFPRTNETMSQQQPPATDSPDTVLATNVASFIQSLPLFDPAYVRACVGWGPKPSCVTNNRARKTLQFLSCTSFGDGLSKQHMGIILKFIKSLRGPDSAVLPHSTEGCWSVMETVTFPAFVHHKFDIFFTSDHLSTPNTNCACVCH